MSADTPDKRLDAVAFIKRLINAWDCCGTCAGGVLAERDRAVVAAERERIAQAIEAAGPPADYPGGTVAGRAFAICAGIARGDAS